MEELIIRQAKIEEWDDAMELAFRVFLKFEAQEYGQAGTDAFRKFISDKMLKKLFETGHYKLFLAFYNKELVGMTSLRNGNHVSLLFVKETFHNKGIGKKLIRCLEEHLKRVGEHNCLTVNAAPYAISFYHKLGFKDMGEKVIQDNIIFLPMRKIVV